MPYTQRFNLAGRRALVTGGSKGIGMAIAVLFAEAGADLAIVGRDRAGLEDTSKRVRDLGRECRIIEADLRETTGPQKAAREALDHFGTIDILVNNAGIAHRSYHR